MYDPPPVCLLGKFHLSCSEYGLLSSHARPVAPPLNKHLHCTQVAVTACITACRSLSQNVRPAAGLSARQIPPQLQWMRVVVVTCTTRGSSACLLCNSNKHLHCKQFAVTACTTRWLCLSVLQLKANVNSERKCRSLPTNDL